jgi:DNA (cytosine-5)-methyltransferase 1
MIYGSVCSGIEAATMAWHTLGWVPKFFSEVAAHPSAVLAHHYGSNMPGEPLATNGIPNHGDFTKIEKDAGPIDLLVGGTPCQSFSVAGKRLGLDDPRGNLALEYLALARRLRARWFVWENVPGVFSSVSDEEAGDGGVRPGLEGRVPGDEWFEESDFATFLSFVSECGYGFAYRVLDAQYIRVDGYARAVPQRRQRIIVVGYLGDFRPAAAVLFEPEGMRGDPAPRRKAGQRPAPTISSRPTGGGGLGTDFDLDGGLIPQAFGGGNRSGSIDVSTALTALTAHGVRQDFEVETFIAEVANTLPAGGNSTGGNRQPGTGAETAATMLVAHALRGEGFDASEDGTGRGTPIVPVFIPDTAATLTRGAESAGKGGYAGRRQEDDVNIVAHAIQAGAIRENPDSGPDGVGVQADLAYTVEARAEVQAVAFDMRGREGGSQFEGPHETANIRAASGGSSKSYVAQPWAVRRLTPVECERLQGFPDNFTNVPWRGKNTSPDGPRYKDIGNSMAVNVMRWVGMRIDIMEGLIQSGQVVPSREFAEAAE